jgi:hypothetical protein
MRKNLWRDCRLAFAFAFIHLCLALPDRAYAESGADPRNSSVGAAACSASRQPVSETRYRQYVIRIFGDQESDFPDGCVEVIRHGNRVWSYEGGTIVWFQLGGIWREGGRERPLPLGRDVTGTGVPNVVIRQYVKSSGGNVSLLILGLGEQFRYLTSIHLDAYDNAYFADLRGDGRQQLVTWDPAWRCWRSACAYSAAPRLVLQYRDGQFRLADDLMRKRPPTARDLRARIRKIAAAPVDGDGGVPTELWKQMLDLIYSGNASAAWRLFETAWPRAAENKEGFLGDLRKKLAASEYWPDIRKLNHGQISGPFGRR